MKRSGHLDSETGLTLVELLIYIFVVALVVGGLAAIFINSWSSDTQTRERDVATGWAQALSTSLHNAIRNSAGSVDIAEEGTLLRARVAEGSNGWTCRAWKITDNKELWTTSSSSAIAAGPYTNGDGWRLLRSGITGTFVAGVSREVEFQFSVSVGDTTVAVSGGATAQAAGKAETGAGDSCVG